MKASTVLRSAAGRINTQLKSARGDRAGCCSAITEVAGGRHNAREIPAYQRASDYLSSLYRNGNMFWFGGSFSKKEQEHRIIALLLTADMAESVGD